MDAVTYPQETVIDFLSNNSIVPLKIATDQPEAADHKVTWTPALLILDAEGKEHQRIVGFVPPEEFAPTLLLEMGKTYFNLNEFPKALEKLEEVMTKFPNSDSAPEAVFFAGVSGYKNSGDPIPLRKAYDYLADKYPENLWTKRALPYRLIG